MSEHDELFEAARPDLRPRCALITATGTRWVLDSYEEVMERLREAEWDALLEFTTYRDIGPGIGGDIEPYRMSAIRGSIHQVIELTEGTWKVSVERSQAPPTAFSTWFGGSGFGGMS